MKPIPEHCPSPLADGTYTNATVEVYKGRIVRVESGVPFLYKPSTNSDHCKNSGGGGHATVGLRGEKGRDGESATITIGSVTTTSGQAEVTNSGTSTHAILNFKIPKGDDGASGNVSGDTGNHLGLTIENGLVVDIDPSHSVGGGRVKIYGSPADETHIRIKAIENPVDGSYVIKGDASGLIDNLNAILEQFGKNVGASISSDSDTGIWYYSWQHISGVRANWVQYVRYLCSSGAFDLDATSSPNPSGSWQGITSNTIDKIDEYYQQWYLKHQSKIGYNKLDDKEARIIAISEVSSWISNYHNATQNYYHN